MLEFNLEYCRAFYYVAQLGSVSKAATALYISQPAVTRSIKKLEEHLHCRLFLRASHGVRTTNEGEVFFRYVSNAFEELIKGEKEVQRLSLFDAGHLEIGATETALFYFLLPKIEAFRKQHPNVYIHMSGSTTPETVDMVRRGTADLAVAVSPLLNTDGLDVTPVYEFHDAVLASDAFGELRGRSITTLELSRYPLVTVEKQSSARNNLDIWFSEQGVLFEPEYTVRTSSAILPFVQRGLAVGVVPAMFAHDWLQQQSNLFLVDMEQVIPARKILVIYRKNPEISLLCRQFADYLLDMAEV